MGYHSSIPIPRCSLQSPMHVRALSCISGRPSIALRIFPSEKELTVVISNNNFHKLLASSVLLGQATRVFHLRQLWHLLTGSALNESCSPLDPEGTQASRRPCQSVLRSVEPDSCGRLDFATPNVWKVSRGPSVGSGSIHSLPGGQRT